MCVGPSQGRALEVVITRLEQRGGELDNVTADLQLDIETINLGS